MTSVTCTGFYILNDHFIDIILILLVFVDGCVHLDCILDAVSSEVMFTTVTMSFTKLMLFV